MSTDEPASMRRQILDIVQGKRAAVLVVVYSVIVGFSLYISYQIRFDFSIPSERKVEIVHLIWLVIGIKLLMLFFARQMGSMLTFFGVPDIFRLGSAFLFSAALLLLPRFIGLGFLNPPRGVLLMDLLVCMAAFCSLRLAARLFRERYLMQPRIKGRALERVAIVGAGDTGATLVASLINTPSKGFRPVAFLDDDKSKHGMFIHGVAVEGTPERFPFLPQLEDVRRVIIAMPSAPKRRVAELALFFARLGIQVETVPALEDLASGRARVNRLRPVEIQDLLGRSVVELDTDAIGHFVAQKVIVVTGAGGSIGSELCRQLARLNPRRLILVDQSEPALFEIEQELCSLGYSEAILPIMGDIMDLPRMRNLFSTHSPHLIFHAAAHKHVHLMERQPSEALKNNSIGTRKLAEIAVECGVETFVLISTDKAINPTSVMGASKRLAELHLMALHSGLASEDTSFSEAQEFRRSASPQAANKVSIAEGEGTGAKSSRQSALRSKLLAVRFGNVLGSSGSVVPIFKRQIEAGGPVTVTHPDVTRYFMTIPEAVGLVLQSAVLSNGGEILVLDMGSPVKIVDLARNMIELSGHELGSDIEIKFTGLRLGEKLFEELQHSSEQHLPTSHPRIFRFIGNGDSAKASKMALEELEPFVDELSNNDLKRILKVVIPEYRPSLE